MSTSTAAAPTAQTTRRELLVVALAWALSRVGAFVLGVRFDYDTVETHWQFLDPRQLETALVESLTWLHAQPPLLNLLYGALARVSPADRGSGLAMVLFLVLGLASALAVYALLVRLGARRFAPYLTAVLILDPAAILFESYFFYTHLVMALLALAAYSLERFLATERTSWLVAFLVTAGALPLLRSSFHLVWLVAVAAGLVVVSGSRRRTGVALAAIPVLVTASWYAKNLALFGHFTASTWMGMNVTKVVSNGYSDDEVAALVRGGLVTPLYWESPFGPVESYARYLPPSPPTGHAVLDDARKASGWTNYNNIAYVGLSERYLDDSRRVLEADPLAIVRTQPDSWGLYFQPSGQYFRFIGAVFARSGRHAANLEAIGGVERVFNAVVWLQPSPEPPGEALLAYHRPEMRAARALSMSLTSLAGTALVTVAVPAIAVRRWRAGRPGRNQAAVLAFMWGCFVYVALVGNLLEIGENQRFKFETEALWLVLLGVTLTELLALVATHRSRLRGADARPNRGSAASS